MNVVRLDNIVKKFPGTLALNKVNFRLDKSTIMGLVGKNGAGKTTLINIISGRSQPDSGDIYFFNSKTPESINPHKALTMGISVIPQEPEDIPYMTITQNLFLGNWPINKFGVIKIKELEAMAKEICMNCKLNIDVRERVVDLTIAERQLVSMAKAFYSQKNKIVILDEVNAALDKQGREEVYRLVHEAVDTGISIIYISHELDEIFQVCTSLTVLRDGRNIVTKKVSDTNKKEVTDLIVGKKIFFTSNLNKQSVMEKEKEGIMSKSKKVEEILSIQKLYGSDILKNISLMVYKNDIVGLAGLRGSGRTELLKTIIGYNRIDSGNIYIKGKEVKFKDPSDAINHGICLLPEDREREGLFHIRSVKENITISSINKILNKYMLIKTKYENSRVESVLEKLNIVTSSIENEVENLSGGNKQKVIVGRMLEVEPILYLLDEPTKGIDVGAKKYLLDFIKSKLAKQAAIIIVSSEFEDLLQVCNRIVLIKNGKIIKEFADINNVTESTIYSYLEGVGEKENEK